MVAEPGSRRFYLTDFTDEIVPCDCTLAGWAAWLAAGDADWDVEPARDGQLYEGSAILFGEDIIATCRDGEWSLSRELAGEQFVAVRFGSGQGWSAEDLIDPDSQLLDHFREYAQDDGQVHIAVGMVEEGWRFTFRDGEPPVLDAERLQ
ncbi:MAG: hypothetical protein ABIR02_08185 [Novosphingobium sp.]